MDMVCPDEGKTFFLKLAMQCSGFGADDCHIDLFQNDVTPDDDSVLADFVASSFGGYVSIPLGSELLAAPAIVAHVAEVTYPGFVSFICTSGSPQPCYGWYMWAENAFVCCLAQRFDTPRIMGPGAVISLDPWKVKLKTLV